MISWRALSLPKVHRRLPLLRSGAYELSMPSCDCLLTLCLELCGSGVEASRMPLLRLHPLKHRQQVQLQLCRPVSTK